MRVGPTRVVTDRFSSDRKEAVLDLLTWAFDSSREVLHSLLFLLIFIRFSFRIPSTYQHTCSGS